MCNHRHHKTFHVLLDQKYFFHTIWNFKHDYVKKFCWSCLIFNWSSYFFIGHGPRTQSLQSQKYNQEKKVVARCQSVVHPDSKVHGANVGPTWVLYAQGSR